MATENLVRVFRETNPAVAFVLAAVGTWFACFVPMHGTLRGLLAFIAAVCAMRPLEWLVGRFMMWRRYTQPLTYLKRALWTVAAVVAGFVLAALLLAAWALGQIDDHLWVKIVGGFMLFGFWIGILEQLGDHAPTVRAATTMRVAYWSILGAMVIFTAAMRNGLQGVGELGWWVVVIVAAVMFYRDNVVKPLRQLEARIADLERARMRE
jgi:hypothetical protein